MIAGLRRALAAYDRWCRDMGLAPEHRRSCAPVRYDMDDPRHPVQRAQQTVLAETDAVNEKGATRAKASTEATHVD